MNNRISQQVIAEQLLNNPKRIIGLDLLRISLALLIFMFHSQMHFKCSYGYLGSFVEKGAIAMTGFMILSGYVLYSSYSKVDLTKIKDIKEFYLKRIIAIIPMYYSIMALYIVLKSLVGSVNYVDVLLLFPVDLIALQSTFFSIYPYIHHGGTWFISCLLISYILYPFLQSIIRQISDRSRKYLLIVLFSILLYAPIIGILFELDWINLYANPFYRFIEFAIGAILARSFMRNGGGQKSVYTILSNHSDSIIYSNSYIGSNSSKKDGSRMRLYVT